MANCFLPLPANPTASNNNNKVKNKVKFSNHHSTIALVKNLFTRFSYSSRKSSKHVPISSLLKKIDKAYDNLPTSSAPDKSFSHPSSVRKKSAKRIKVVITKQQLKELSSKKIRTQDILPSGTLLSCIINDSTHGPPTALLSCITRDVAHGQWKPKLESIPEGKEL